MQGQAEPGLRFRPGPRLASVRAMTIFLRRVNGNAGRLVKNERR